MTHSASLIRSPKYPGNDPILCQMVVALHGILLEVLGCLRYYIVSTGQLRPNVATLDNDNRTLFQIEAFTK